MSSLENNYRLAQRCRCDLVNERELQKLYLEQAESSDGLWHGPVPLAEWQERFLPATGTTSPAIDFSAVHAIPDPPSIANCLYDSAICSTVFPRATHSVHGQDHTTGTFLSPDISILAQKLDIDHDSRRLRDELLGSTLAFGEITSEDRDPCAFADGRPDSKEAASVRGRLLAIMRAVAVNSHRTFCYAFVVMPKYARLLRFDHSGITFTELFPWRTSGDLADFLYRFDNMNDAERGLDTSVTTIPSASQEARQAKGILAKSDALPQGISKTSVIPKNYRGPLSLMRVYDDESMTFHRVVVHRAIKAAEHYLGRSTRGFYGVDLDEGAVVYVKDAWRIVSTGSVPEAATYRRLEAHNVPHLPGFYHGGDVPTCAPASPSSYSTSPVTVQKQKTTVHDANATVYTHHRLLFKTIGRPLKTFHSTHQLCTALSHALESHAAAYQHAKVLHRDVSGGNVLIDKDGRGILIDWDMCVWCEDTSEMERIGQPIGTWPFISADLLMARDPRAHLLRDDLESFLHVLFYHVLRYRPMYPEGSDDRSILIDSLKEVFDGARWRVPNGRVVGGKAKASFLAGTTYFACGELRAHIRPSPLLGLLEDLRDAFEPLYSSKPDLSLYQPDDEEYAAILEELQEHQISYSAALERFRSSEHMLSMFQYWTQDCTSDGYEWLSDDGADDIYMPRSVPSLLSSVSRSSRKRSVPQNAPTSASKLPRLRSSRTSSIGAAGRDRGREEP
ncbi:unnamed protein product [Peniophora sp. CBMAI 1063]|nr:unnamed protein product [Peniophora sp. CBMAI 1063]